MSREAYPLVEAEEVYCRHDPVTHRLKCYLRARHNRIRSPRLEALLACVQGQETGRRYRGHGAVEDTLMVRQGFAKASRTCSREVGAAG